MPSPVTDPAGFSAALRQQIADQVKADAKQARKGRRVQPGNTGIVNNGTMHGVQNNPGAVGGRQVSNGVVNEDQGDVHPEPARRWFRRSN
jgi:chemotaxis response regulator CheB